MAVGLIDTRYGRRRERLGASDLAPARGIVIGLIFSSILWALLALVVLVAVRL